MTKKSDSRIKCVKFLKPVPTNGDGQCADPYEYDILREGVELNEDGRFHVMFCLSQKKGEVGLVTDSLGQDIVIVDETTGKRLWVDMSIFDKE